jgi:hypothetical protein
MLIRAASLTPIRPLSLEVMGAAALLITMAVPGPAGAERLFTPPFMYLYTAPYSVNRVGIADITGDRVPDVVYSGSFSDPWEYHARVGSLLGPMRDFELRRGTYGAGADGEGDVGLGEMGAGDVNGDGRSDVVTIVTSEDGTVKLTVSLGSPGGFQGGSAMVINAPGSLAVGDFDGDGKSDVAVTRFDPDSVVTFRGRADGGLAPFSGFAVSPAPAVLAVGDLDNDGRLDIVGVDGFGRCHSYLGDGRGGFQPHWEDAVPGGQWRLGLADFNHDGHLDLIVQGGVLLGDGTGGFGAKLGHGVEGPFAVGDFNSDGRLDLAVASNTGLLSLLGKGDGTFTQVSNRNAPSTGAVTIAVGDVDQDGNLDLVAGSLFLHGNGDGTFGYDVPSYGVDDKASTLSAGDVNGDGRTDLAVLNQGSSVVSMLLSTSAGTFLAKRDFDTGAVPQDLLLVDFDRDGRLDLAIAQPEARHVSIFGGHGDGTFGPPTVIPITGKPRSLASGDLDEDGFLDLVVSSDAGVWAFFGGAGGVGGSGRFTSVMPFPGTVGWPYTASRGRLIAVDFTGDGHLDIALLGNDVDFVTGNGNGTFGTPGSVWADHDNDGGYAGPLLAITDDACSHRVMTTWYCCGCTNCGDDYSLEMVLGPGCGEEGCFGSVAGLNGLGSASDQVGDLNGDGTEDVLTSGGFVLFGPRFESRQQIGISGVVGDLNGDGKLDLFRYRDSNTPPRRSVEVFFNQSARPTVPQSPAHVGAVSGGASIALSWDPVLHPDLAGYRVRYGVGQDASGGPSPIDVPLSQTSLTLHCLSDSTFWVKVTSVDRLGRESKCTRSTSARPGPVGGDFSFMGGSLNAASHGRWAMGLVQLDASMSAARIVPGTVTVNGVGPADQLGVTDRDHDGRSELMIRFPRSAVQGTNSRVLVEGRVAGCRDTLRFAVDDSVRVRKPGATPQAGAEDGHGDDPPVIAFALHPVAPSPASGGCAMAFDLPELATVRLSVYDLGGRLMSTVLDRDMPAGSHRVWWDRQSLPDGVYFAKIQAGRFRAVRTIVLIR